MKKVLHISSECYPAAKAGGMGDVVGALPGYLPAHDILASAVIPKYDTKWFSTQNFKTVHKGTFKIAGDVQPYTVQLLQKSTLAFPFYCVDLPGLFDRDAIYLAEDGHGFKDEPKRNIAFQTAILEWLSDGKAKFDLLHVHDHMTGLMPFFMQYGTNYTNLKETPCVLTIHNGSYRGEFKWDEVKHMLPQYDEKHSGLLDWDGQINSLAVAIKCAWAINTVSPSYMQELILDSDTLIPLYNSEIHKCTGILNGIDAKLWDPKSDTYLDHHLENDWKQFKSKNKTFIQKKFNLVTRRPLVGFIGRFAHQKGADLLVDSIISALEKKLKFIAVILGSGDKVLEAQVESLSAKHPRVVGSEIGYNEKLARQIYAGCDFLIMPSRFEPCGLNQLYAMQYGTIPIASQVGGLKDTVHDITEDGEGITISPLTVDNLTLGIEKSIDLYKDKKTFAKLIKSNNAIDHSWHYAAGEYAKLYLNHIK